MNMASILSHAKISNYVAQIRRIYSVWCQEMHLFLYFEPYDLERNVTPLFHIGKAPGE